MENLKIKLVVLWVFLAVSVSVGMVLMFMMPGVIEEIMAGELEGMLISEGYLLVLALFWLIPFTMAFLSLTLKDSANRWANIIVGIAWAGLGILACGRLLIQGQLTLALLEVSRTVVAALIVRYAWKWPKKEA
ncbi:MAG: hypothetical protein JSW00_10160 [Thermoplasmata archaeon]|nr:MAG: hypothetical protein JSW00_10160 [Thermoplasmata archaeon]